MAIKRASNFEFPKEPLWRLFNFERWFNGIWGPPDCLLD